MLIVERLTVDDETNRVANGDLDTKVYEMFDGIEIDVIEVQNRKPESKAYFLESNFNLNPKPTPPSHCRLGI